MHNETEKLTRCPFCSEKILSTAKKCRFCGEWFENDLESLKPKAKSNSRSIHKFSIPLALISLLVISTAAFGYYENTGKTKSINSSYNSISNSPATIPAQENGDAFVDSILTEINSVRTDGKLEPLEVNKDIVKVAKDRAENICASQKWSLNSGDITQIRSKLAEENYSFMKMGVSLASDFDYASQLVNSWMSSTENKENILNKSYTETGIAMKECALNGIETKVVVEIFAQPAIKSNVITPKNNTTSTSTVKCIGPDGKQFDSSLDDCKVFNEKWGKPLNYMLNCSIHPDCGGGTVYISKGECDKPCTSRISNPTTKIPTAINTTNSNNKSAVFISYGGYTVYCPAQNVGAVMQISSTMENKKMEWAKNYNTCSDNFTNSDSCWLNCKNTHTWSECVYGSPEYQTCNDKVSESYRQCIATCPSTSDHCSYVYSEQKSLSSQITNLCK